ncbi:MAG: flippase-like domain-containing protein [Methanospirillum sp.]|nr:flippase-like domain-containing protein [Methanospirillum sp.]
MERRKIWIYGSFAFSAIILVIILLSTFNEETFLYLSHLNICFLGLAIGLRFLSFGLWAERIRLMCRALEYRVPFKTCYLAVIANLLIAAITPSSAGGEAVRIHELYRSGMKVGDATAVVITERFLDAIILVVLAVSALLLMWDVIMGLGDAFIIIIFFSIAVLILFDLLLVMAAKHPVRVKRKVMQILTWLGNRMHNPSVNHLVTRTDEEFDQFANGLMAFTGDGRKGLFQGFIFSLLFWISEFTVASVILAGLGLPPSFGNSLFAQIIIALVSMIPLTPGASGIAEISATSLYALFVPTAALGVFVLLWRLIMFYLNVVLGLIGAILIVKREVGKNITSEGCS